MNNARRIIIRILNVIGLALLPFFILAQAIIYTLLFLALPAVILHSL